MLPVASCKQFAFVCSGEHVARKQPGSAARSWSPSPSPPRTLERPTEVKLQNTKDAASITSRMSSLESGEIRPRGVLSRASSSNLKNGSSANPATKALQGLLVELQDDHPESPRSFRPNLSHKDGIKSQKSVLSMLQPFMKKAVRGNALQGTSMLCLYLLRQKFAFQTGTARQVSN